MRAQNTSLSIGAQVLFEEFHQQLDRRDQLKEKNMTIHLGYWHERKGDGLPKPVARKKKWKGQDKLVAAIQTIITHDDVEANRFKGYSTCRICEKRNGSIEYKIGKFAIPEGLPHYIQKHNVKPDLRTRKIILKLAKQKPAKKGKTKVQAKKRRRDEEE